VTLEVYRRYQRNLWHPSSTLNDTESSLLWKVCSL